MEVFPWARSEAGSRAKGEARGKIREALSTSSPCRAASLLLLPRRVWRAAFSWHGDGVKRTRAERPSATEQRERRGPDETYRSEQPCDQTQHEGKRYGERHNRSRDEREVQRGSI